MPYASTLQPIYYFAMGNWEKNYFPEVLMINIMISRL